MEKNSDKELLAYIQEPNIRKKLNVALALALINVLAVDDDITNKQYLCSEKKARAMVD